MPCLVPNDSGHAYPSDLETRALAAVMGRGRLADFFMTALRRANQLFGTALLLQVAELRRAGDPVERSFARTKELELQLSFAWQTIDILLERLGRVAPAHRPHYRKTDRGRILQHKDVFHLSCREVARLYAVTRSTIHRWVVDSVAPKRPDRPLVAPAPPDRTYSALVRQQVLNMAMAGFGGSLRIAQTLALEGIRLSRSTVRRWTKETMPTPAAPTDASSIAARETASGERATTITEGAKAPSLVERAVRARRPNHVLMVDVTVIKALMGLLSFRLAVVIDVFSRFPLAWRLFDSEPSAEEMASVLDEAVSRARRLHPGLSLAHFVTDKGACFTAAEFQETVSRHGMKARFGAVGRHGSIAFIERLWRGLKDLLHLRLDRRLLREDLEPRIGLGLFYYSVLKPHQGLGGATPAEVYFQKEPARLSAVPPPREIDPIPPPAFVIRHLDAARRLPVLFRKAA
ncbi:MAG TPA: DDE-type integrase/transposase/recombinase [Thermoanaerobaculia bacterium]|nr:DDE-type integrase/transposase/recombinase [Thermoanaerobaculia bacterium]